MLLYLPQVGDRCQLISYFTIEETWSLDQRKDGNPLCLFVWKANQPPVFVCFLRWSQLAMVQATHQSISMYTTWLPWMAMSIGQALVSFTLVWKVSIVVFMHNFNTCQTYSVFNMNHSWNYSWIKCDAMLSCLYLLFSPSYLSMLVVVKSVVLLLEG